ncbi:MAG: crotonase/enoyl-CoA hydratase family protein [Sphingomonadales bacterium]|nr:crotonase/enoyl-CoA hydratase family protein [Sphingomonadales bacterium]MDE2570086.1 crotonase/enoyl-CoA hydratase family protein [Sphingomonadales bacterium]
MTVHVSDEGPVRTVVIDRPDCRNAVDPPTAMALLDAFAAFDADESLSVAVLAGAGGTFCAGFDLRAVGRNHDRHDPEGRGPMGPTRMLLSKPVIAAVEGFAVAGGLELALWCDLRVAAEGATFGVFCRRWGVPLIDGGTVRLPRIVGQGGALDMILTGRPVGAREALEMGLANRVVPDGEALAAARALAADIARFPQVCLRADLASAYSQFDQGLADALRAEGQGGEAPLRQEAAAGASRFTGGEGRGGRFD